MPVLILHETASVACASLAAEVGGLLFRALALADAAADAEEDAGEEESADGAPGKAISFDAKRGSGTGVVEGFTSHDGP